MKIEAGSLSGGSEFDRAVALAGLLAEHSVKELTLTHAGESQLLRARTVDLPSSIQLGVKIECIVAPGDAFTALVCADRIEWTTSSISLAAALRRIQLT